MRLTIGAYILAILAGLMVSALLVAMSGTDVGAALQSLLVGAVGSPSAIVSSLGSATPLIFTGLATVIAYRAEVWSVGQEGQVLAGAMLAYQASLVLAGAPPAVIVLAALAAGMVGGALLGGLAALLKARFGVNEIVSTVMLNYVVGYLLSYLIGGGPWAATGGTVTYLQTPRLPQDAWLPLLAPDSKLHVGLLVGLALVGTIQLMLKRTALGYEIRAMGANAVALGQRGTNTVRTVLLVMLLSGGIAGLAGVGELFGVAHRLRLETVSGLGFSGIIIGMVGNLTPMGTLLAALFFGALQSGALYMNVSTNVPGALVPAMQGIILLFCLVAGVVAQFELVMERR
ncbi:MAG: ABC transporter permease [Devosia sp.]|nr:ABC transporter permease [Devosia sp.]